jgi:hypothetical protein
MANDEYEIPIDQYIESTVSAVESLDESTDELNTASTEGTAQNL